MFILNEELKVKVREYLKHNNIKKVAFSSSIGVSYGTLYRWLKNDEDVKISSGVFAIIVNLVDPTLAEKKLGQCRPHLTIKDIPKSNTTFPKNTRKNRNEGRILKVFY